MPNTPNDITAQDILQAQLREQIQARMPNQMAQIGEVQKANDYSRVMGVLRGNEDKQFVQRILRPNEFPAMNLGKGQTGTHLMAWTKSDGKYYVYPTIEYDTKSKSLTNWGADRGWEEAKKKGEMISFDTPQEADWFSKNYKMVWPQE